MKYQLTILLFILGIQGIAQSKQTIRFTVTDSSTNESIRKGRIYLTFEKDTISSFAFTEGSFLIDCSVLSRGSKILTIECPKYTIVRLDLFPNTCLTNNTFTIKLNKAAFLLKEVIVTSSLIRQDIDKITYNVVSDEERKELSLLEFMPKLPFVSLSSEDKLLFKGKENFLVLLNGRRSSMFSNRVLRESLKAIPANNISKIEIFTDIPAKYENEGYSCVINIITLKNPADGYNGSINSNVGTFISGVSSVFNVKKKKFGITVGLGKSVEQTPFNSEYTETVTKSSIIIQKGENKINSASNYINFLPSYEIDSLNLITFDVGVGNTTQKNLKNIYVDQSSTNTNQNGSYYFDQSQNEISDNLQLNFNYQRNFKNKKDRLLTFSYLFNHNKENNNQSTTIAKSVNYFSNNSSQFSNTIQSNRSYQIDYVLPLLRSRLEVGTKHIYRNMSSDFLSNSINPVSNITTVDTSNTGRVNYFLSIYGIYSSYSFKAKRVAFRFGFRFEGTSLTGGNENRNQDIHQSYANFLPSAKIQYKAPNTNALSILFKQTIQRPSIFLLNPIIIKSAPGFGSVGNPNLNPVLTNVFNFEFSRFKKYSLSVSLTYSFAKNTIQGVTSNRDDTLVLTTFDNIGIYQRVGVDNSYEVPITSKIDFSVDGSLFYVKVRNYKIEGNYTNSGIEGFIYSYLTYKLKKFRFTANLGYYGPTINIQAKSNSYFYSSFAVAKQVLHSKGNILFRVSNPFNKFRHLNTTLISSDVSQIREQDNLFRGFGLSFNYRFGKLSESIKRNKRSLQIDDGATPIGKIK